MTSNDSILTAHVADELERSHGAQDYDAAAEYADQLLEAYPWLAAAADEYAHGVIGLRQFSGYVARAVAANTADGGF
jgi:hypothetical protein